MVSQVLESKQLGVKTPQVSFGVKETLRILTTANPEGSKNNG